MTETVSPSQDDTKTESHLPQSASPSSPKSKPKALKHANANDGNERPRTSEKVEKPPTKVVVRRLPPTMTLETFLDQVAPLPPVDYMYFVKADSSLAPNSFARAYLHFVHIADLLIFTEKFDNYVFVDSKGNEYPAVVEFAPFQRIPKQRSSRKKDPRIGTIENDPYFQDFIEALKAEETQRKSASKTNKQHFFETSTSQIAPKVTSTPLLEYLKARRADKLRTKEDKIAEKRKREIERRKTREDARTSFKHIKTPEGDNDITPPTQIKPPQPSSLPPSSSDLAEIQTRYLRCMIGLDKDTSGLEQVSCSACRSNSINAPHQCQVLRERMHQLMLHISDTNSTAMHVSNIDLKSIDPNQSDHSVESSKPSSLKKLVKAEAQLPTCPDVPVSSCDQVMVYPAVCENTPSYISNAYSGICGTGESKLIAPANFPTPIVLTPESSSGKLLSLSSKESYHILPKFKSQPIKSTKQCENLDTALSDPITQAIQRNAPAIMESTQTKQSITSLGSSCSKQTKKKKVNMKLREIFSLLERGAVQVQCPTVSSHSISQMTTLQELERQLFCKEGGNSKCSSVGTSKSPCSCASQEKSQSPAPKWKKSGPPSQDILQWQLGRYEGHVYQCLRDKVSIDHRAEKMQTPPFQVLLNRGRPPTRHVHQGLWRSSPLRLHSCGVGTYQTPQRYGRYCSVHHKALHSSQKVYCDSFMNGHSSLRREHAPSLQECYHGAQHPYFGWRPETNLNSPMRMSPIFPPCPLNVRI